MRRKFTIAGVLIFVGLMGCGPAAPPDAPTISLDRDSLGFGLEFGSGTYIGTEVQNSLSIKNEGQNDLTISAIDLSGDSVFRMETVSMPPITVKGLKTTFVVVYFRPTEEKTYNGSIKITSNATNATTKDVPLSGKGVKPTPDAGP